MIDSRVLRTFLAICREGSISGAARQLNISQPSVSVAIAQLEQQLGSSLFDRGRRGIALTEAGKVLMRRAEMMESLLRDAEEAVALTRQGVRGPLRIGGTPGALVSLVPATIAAEQRVPEPIAMQLEYSLVARDVEAEHFSTAREGGMGIMPCSPLAGGFLSGKYRREDTTGTGRLSGANPFGDSKFTDGVWNILDTLIALAREIGQSPAAVALAWTLHRQGRLYAGRCSLGVPA